MSQTLVHSRSICGFFPIKNGSKVKKSSKEIFLDINFSIDLFFLVVPTNPSMTVYLSSHLLVFLPFTSFSLFLSLSLSEFQKDCDRNTLQKFQKIKIFRNCHKIKFHSEEIFADSEFFIESIFIFLVSTFF